MRAPRQVVYHRPLLHVTVQQHMLTAAKACVTECKLTLSSVRRLLCVLLLANVVRLCLAAAKLVSADCNKSLGCTSACQAHSVILAVSQPPQSVDCTSNICLLLCQSAHAAGWGTCARVLVPHLVGCITAAPHSCTTANAVVGNFSLRNKHPMFACICDSRSILLQFQELGVCFTCLILQVQVQFTPGNDCILVIEQVNFLLCIRSSDSQDICIPILMWGLSRHLAAL